MSRITSSQVAKLAGVSRTTVSFVLNGALDKGISESTRDKVYVAAQQLGYVPNANARALVSGLTHLVALAMPVSDQQHLNVDAYLPRLLAGINLRCYRDGYKLIVEPVYDTSHTHAIRNLVEGGRIDGLISLNPRSVDEDYLCTLAERSFPLVVLGSTLPKHEAIYGIGTNNRAAMRKITEHLLHLGHRNIAHIGFADFDNTIARERLLGFSDAMRAAHARIQQSSLAHGDYSAESGYQAMRQIFKQKQTITALAAGNDTIAFGAMAAIREAGLRIPQDVAVTGYDDISLSNFASPPLTTMHTDPFATGQNAADLILSIIYGSRPKEIKIQEESQLIIRVSCGSKKLSAAKARGGSRTKKSV